MQTSADNCATKTAGATMAEADELELTMQEALAEVRREERKAALIYASIDAMFVGTAIALGGTFIGLESAVDVTIPYGLNPTTVLSLGSSVLTLVVEYVLRMRGRPGERFEGVNEVVEPALRTARDTLSTDRDLRMARELYADVLDELQSTSSTKLLRSRRLAIPLIAAIVFSLGTVQLAAAGIDVSTVGPAGSSSDQVGPTAGSGDPGSVELQDGSQVLGNATNVSAGSEQLNATLSTSAGSGDGSVDAVDSGGLPSASGPAEVDARRTGFSESEDIENGELIKEYNLAIRDEQNNE